MARKQYAVYVVSLGCPKNLVDTEVMCGQIGLAGFALTDRCEAADILLINTCSFIREARDEAGREIHSALRWKRKRRGRRVVVSGCLPQRDLAEARRLYPKVDLFLGLDDVPRTADLLSALVRGGQAPHQASQYGPPTYLYDDRTPRMLATGGPHAYVKIADGCDHFCRFCAIPTIRGRQRSRSMDSVVAECRNLLAMGVRELDLVAQDSTRYGADRDDGSSLPELLRRCDALEGRYWLRLLYTHPRHFTDELMRVFAEAQHLVSYVDIPLQHISDPVLRAMGRGVDEAGTRVLMARLREQIPGVAVRTTFLVGYPGEAEADFDALSRFVEDYRFDRMGVFVYSPEAGTPAAGITEGLVPRRAAETRRAQLMEQQQAISAERNAAMVGQTVEVLVHGPERPGWHAARTTADAPDIDNVVHVRTPGRRELSGFLTVRITEADTYDLEAEVV